MGTDVSQSVDHGLMDLSILDGWILDHSGSLDLQISRHQIYIHPKSLVSVSTTLRTTHLSHLRVYCYIGSNYYVLRGGGCPVSLHGSESMGLGSMDHGSMDHGSMDHGSMDHGSIYHVSWDPGISL